eukprot:m.211926 g.211926  ORF g.211926 m.211926 type:complete len:483 (-) comp18582_c0_seq2:214-1662(-)
MSDDEISKLCDFARDKAAEADIRFAPADNIFRTALGVVSDKETPGLLTGGGGATLCERFRVKSYVQSGSFGRGWCVYDEKAPDSRPLFIKTFRSYTDRHSKSTPPHSHEAAIQKEIQFILKQNLDRISSHDHIVRTRVCYGPIVVPLTKQTGQMFFQLSDFCDGGELFDYLVIGGKARPFSEPVARNLFGGLAKGIAHLHDNGVFHRDLKLENILLDSRYRCRIIDFGSAKWEEDCVTVATASGEKKVTNTRWCGTEAYQPPELTQGAYNPAAFDVWSAAVILFFMTGLDVLVHKNQGFHLFRRICERRPGFRHLLDGDTRDSTGTAVNRAFWQFFAGTLNISKDLQNLFNRMLDVNPEKRITMNQVLEHPWMTAPPASEEELVADMRKRPVPPSRDVKIDLSAYFTDVEDAIEEVEQAMIGQIDEPSEVTVERTGNSLVFGSPALFEAVVGQDCVVTLRWISGLFEQWIQFVLDMKKDLGE